MNNNISEISRNLEFGAKAIVPLQTNSPSDPRIRELVASRDLNAANAILSQEHADPNAMAEKIKDHMDPKSIVGVTSSRIEQSVDEPLPKRVRVETVDPKAKLQSGFSKERTDPKEAMILYREIINDPTVPVPAKTIARLRLTTLILRTT